MLDTKAWSKLFRACGVLHFGTHKSKGTILAPLISIIPWLGDSSVLSVGHCLVARSA
jgi:hypothetical protein